jgi:extradiol dioxygenase family protein
VIKLSVSIDVSDLKQAEKFYTEALGCKKKNKDSLVKKKERKTKTVLLRKKSIDFSREISP